MASGRPSELLADRSTTARSASDGENVASAARPLGQNSSTPPSDAGQRTDWPNPLDGHAQRLAAVASSATVGQAPRDRVDQLGDRVETCSQLSTNSNRRPRSASTTPRPWTCPLGLGSTACRRRRGRPRRGPRPAPTPPPRRRRGTRRPGTTPAPSPAGLPDAADAGERDEPALRDLADEVLELVVRPTRLGDAPGSTLPKAGRGRRGRRRRRRARGRRSPWRGRGRTRRAAGPGTRPPPAALALAAAAMQPDTRVRHARSRLGCSAVTARASLTAASSRPTPNRASAWASRACRRSSSSRAASPCAHHSSGTRRTRRPATTPGPPPTRQAASGRSARHANASPRATSKRSTSAAPDSTRSR